MNTSTASVRNSAIRFASSAATAMLLGAALLPATASAADGSVTFTGTLYEAPCDFADNSVTCYSGTQRQMRIPTHGDRSITFMPITQ